MPLRWKIRYKGDVTVVNKHLDSKTKTETEDKIKKKQKEPRKNSRETNKEERKYFRCFWFSTKAKEEANIYNINTLFIWF